MHDLLHVPIVDTGVLVFDCPATVANDLFSTFVSIYQRCKEAGLTIYGDMHVFGLAILFGQARVHTMPVLRALPHRYNFRFDHNTASLVPSSSDPEKATWTFEYTAGDVDTSLASIRLGEMQFECHSYINFINNSYINNFNNCKLQLPPISLSISRKA